MADHGVVLEVGDTDCRSTGEYFDGGRNAMDILELFGFEKAPAIPGYLKGPAGSRDKRIEGSCGRRRRVQSAKA
jgi:hypothetical protein